MFKRFNENHQEIDKELTSLVVAMNDEHIDDPDRYYKLSESALKLAEAKRTLAEAKQLKVPISAEKMLEVAVSIGLTIFVVKHEQMGIITSKMFSSIIRKGV